MAVERKIHYLQAGSQNFKIAFRAPDLYDDISDATGIQKKEENESVDAFSTVGELIRSGQAVRVHIRYQVNSEYKVGRILCDVDKATTVLANLIGKEYNNGEITSAVFPRRRRLR